MAGSSGQVIMMQFEREERESNVRISTVGIADSSEAIDSFVWRGHSALEVRCGSEEVDSKMAPGFQPFCIVQLQPPATCLSAALHSEWQLLVRILSYFIFSVLVWNFAFRYVCPTARALCLSFCALSSQNR